MLLIVVARPGSPSTSAPWASGLTFVERAYLTCMSPRGIVAAAVSALFALELEEAGQPVTALVPVTFIVIVVTVSSRRSPPRSAPDGSGSLDRHPPRRRLHRGPGLGSWSSPRGWPTTRSRRSSSPPTPRGQPEASSRGVLTYTGKPRLRGPRARARQRGDRRGHRRVALPGAEHPGHRSGRRDPRPGQRVLPAAIRR